LCYYLETWSYQLSGHTYFPDLTALFFDYRTLYLRLDEVTDGGCRKEVMANAAVTEDEYFVAPPGNIPLAARDPADYEKNS
jgi:hypothetical protein